MGKTEKREFVRRLTVLLLHLLKCALQPTLQGNSWRLSIANSHDEILDHLDENPSLKAQLDGALATAYRYARHKAAAETGMVEEAFASTCPWSFETARDEGFWP